MTNLESLRLIIKGVVENIKNLGVYAIAPVTEVANTCRELSANVTVTFALIVKPTNPAQPELAVALIDSVPPGFLLPAGVPCVRVHPLGNPSKDKDGLVVEEIGISPVFFSTIEKIAAPEVGEATSLTESITAAGLLPAIPARLKKTPEITTAAATVIAISRITATNGLKPTVLCLGTVITTSPILYYINLRPTLTLKQYRSITYTLWHPHSLHAKAAVTCVESLITEPSWKYTVNEIEYVFPRIQPDAADPAAADV
jgi:hypothetical protein